jgi:hypothetical protein
LCRLYCGAPALAVGKTDDGETSKPRLSPSEAAWFFEGRRLITLPGVTAMTKSTKPSDSELERPTDELIEELARTAKAAYQ